MPKRIPPEVLEYLRQMGKAYGSHGGKTAAKNMTAEERSARAGEEGVYGGSEETDGEASGARACRTCEEIRQALRPAETRELSG